MGSDLSENAERSMAELWLAHCVECTLNDRHHSMHVEAGQYKGQLKGAQSAGKDRGREREQSEI